MRTYFIKKGNHYSSGFHFGINIHNDLSRTINFTDSCKYTLPDAYASGINKAYGFSNGSHLKNSARIGWRYNKTKDMIDLFCYMHIDGKIIMEWDEDIFLMSVPVNTDIKTSISIENYDDYVFRATYSGVTVVKIFETGDNAHINLGYYLYPYFGGTQVAPDNMRIILK